MRIGLWKPLVRRGIIQNPLRSQYLGFASMIAYLKSRRPPQHEVVLDSTKDVDLVGISCVSETHHLVKAVCAGLRRGGFTGPIILGGPHYTALPETMPREADCCVIGPGEQTFAELVDAYLVRYPDLSQIAGIAYRDKCGLLQRTPQREPLALDDIPVDVTVLPDEWMQLSTIRGCPYHCEHCVEHEIQGKPRWLSAERLLEIMAERVRVTGNNNFLFQDDTFLAAPGRLEEMHSLMWERNLLGKYAIQVVSLNANLVKEDTVLMLKEIGVKKLGVGAESWNPRVFSAMKRGIVTQEHVLRTIQYAGKEDMLPVGGAIVAGYPGETKEELADSISRARQMQDAGKFHVWGCYAFQPLPGSRWWDRFFAQGRVSLDMDFSTLRIDAIGHYFSTPWAYWNQAELSRQDFSEIVRSSGFRKGRYFE